MRERTTSAADVEAEAALDLIVAARLGQAVQLGQWLPDARLTAPAARLVLSSRIIEQCAGWAELRPRELVLEHLAWPWCWDQVADELERAGRAAVLRMPGHDGTTSAEGARRTFLESAHRCWNLATDWCRPVPTRGRRSSGSGW